MATFTGPTTCGVREFVGGEPARRPVRRLRPVRRRDARSRRADGADIDAPWLPDGESFFRVNGVDVIPFVEAELNRRFPGRADRRAADPDGLRAAWATLERTWAATLERVAAMPAGTVDVSVDGEWSFAQTLAAPGPGHRHVAGPGDPRRSNSHSTPSARLDRHRGRRPGHCRSSRPSRRRTPRCSRSGPVGSPWCATSSPPSPPTELAAIAARTRAHPQYPETTLSCLHVILEEEWEHHRYAVRDLDAIETTSTS